MNQIFEVSTWRGGGRSPEGVYGTYGFRILKWEENKKFFDRNIPQVSLVLPEGTEIKVKIAPSFWNKCHELRHKAIKSWLQQNGYIENWKYRHPPRFKLKKVGPNKFELIV